MQTYGEIGIKNLRMSSAAHREGYIHQAKKPATFDTLVYIKNGTIRFELSDGTSVCAFEGETVFVPKGSACDIYYMGEKNHSFSFFFETTSGCIAKKITAYTNNPRITELIEEAETEYLERTINNVNYYISYFYKLVYLLQESSEAAKDILNIVPVIRYIDKNYSNSLKVSELAKMAGMSESAFRKAFNIYTGMSPIEYRNSLRIRHAEELMLSGVSMSEAARTVGFNNITFFNRKAKSLQEEEE